MSAVEAHLARAETKSMPPCKCGQPLVLVTSLLNIRSKKSVRLFKCKGCGDRSWDNE